MKFKDDGTHGGPWGGCGTAYWPPLRAGPLNLSSGLCMQTLRDLRRPVPTVFL